MPTKEKNCYLLILHQVFETAIVPFGKSLSVTEDFSNLGLPGPGFTEWRVWIAREDKASLARVKELQGSKQALCNFLLHHFLLKISLQLQSYCLPPFIICSLYLYEHKACQGFCIKVRLWSSLRTNNSRSIWPTFRPLCFDLNLINRTMSWGLVFS